MRCKYVDYDRDVKASPECLEGVSAAAWYFDNDAHGMLVSSLARRCCKNRNLGLYDNYKISLFSVSARAVRATPTQTKLTPAASTCLPTTSVQSSRATRPQMHPALRPRHLARHRMSPCSGALSCKMKPARSPDTPSTNSIHRDCQSERKILPPAERAHRHLNDPRTSTTRYRRK